MLVTFDEKNSQNLHRYSAPSYLTGMGGSPMEAVRARLPDLCRLSDVGQPVQHDTQLRRMVGALQHHEALPVR